MKRSARARATANRVFGFFIAAVLAAGLLLAPEALAPQRAFAKERARGAVEEAAEEVGVDAARLGRIAEAMQGYIDRGEIAGAVTLVERRGRVVWLKAQGVQDLQTRAPMTRDTLFRIYSMTKPITSVATLMLYEDGALRLTDPIAKWIPELANPRVLSDPAGPLDATSPAAKPITVRDLLTHCSGLAYTFTAGEPLSKALTAAGLDGTSKAITPAEWAARLGKLPLAYAPGTHWNYSLSTDVLGLLVERVSGMPFADFLRTRVFEPLEMRDTAFFVPAAKLSRFATNYDPDPKTGRLVAFDSPATSTYRQPPTFASGGGGLVSTAADYARFAAMLEGDGALDGQRLLSRKTVELMTMRHLSESEQTGFGLGGRDVFPGASFGLGVMVSEDLPRSGGLGSVGRHGWAGAAGTWYWVDPEEDLVAILMIQRMSMAQPIAISKDFETAVYQAIGD
jgi:CubicO group peptidase (beta-lactamase class C family)